MQVVVLVRSLLGIFHYLCEIMRDRVFDPEFVLVIDAPFLAMNLTEIVDKTSFKEHCIQSFDRSRKLRSQQFL